MPHAICTMGCKLAAVQPGRDRDAVLCCHPGCNKGGSRGSRVSEPALQQGQEHGARIAGVTEMCNRYHSNKKSTCVSPLILHVNLALADFQMGGLATTACTQLPS
jgi:hypothetical protein